MRKPKKNKLKVTDFARALTSALMRIQILERKMQLLRVHGVAHCLVCEEELQHLTGEDGKRSILDCVKCEAKDAEGKADVH